ncbi:fatty aldehyde dehydrogenase [Lichtheimia corymbifera JMRC:FSU:9682]|uniref:Aldehyde dehydrogenase n=1 Tax=Lichtheimia corymbifera JMRC:FSU:9682 TaxID=1263082 RepID=A0A068SCP9_9FUNG|nr:fatty aldehyde dehydrogenase [Lichtheimia corymbifera JMRC:FSU:9682]
MASSSVLTYSSFDTIEDNYHVVRRVFATGKTRSLKFRKTQIQRLYDLVRDNEERFYDALAKDMRKPRCEAMSGDVAPVLEECLYFLDNLDRLAKDDKIKPRLNMNAMDTLTIRKEPLGAVLVIGCWNYPLQLSMVPVVGAIAAGNTVILKPSEIAPHTAALLTELIPKYLDSLCYRVVNGAVDETTELLKYHWDHIFYTGSPMVGKIVMKAASEHLTGVTLELGGKSPAIILPDADLQIAANRIGWGKFYNCGQICIAVDYVLVPQDKMDEFAEAFRKTVQKWFGSNPKESPYYARMVSERHVKRVVGMLENRKSGAIAVGGDYDVEDRYIAPTLVTDVKFKDEVLMGDEIFGPILPVIPYSNLDDAIHMVNQNHPPLVLYAFTNKKKLAKKILDNTQSGGVCINDCLMHQAEYSLPFGGIGNSGIGNYHGERSYRTFTHERSVMAKKLGMESLMGMRYPPYTERSVGMLRAFMITSPLGLKIRAYKGIVKKLVLLFILLTLYYKRR